MSNMGTDEKFCAFCNICIGSWIMTGSMNEKALRIRDLRLEKVIELIKEGKEHCRPGDVSEELLESVLREDVGNISEEASEEGAVRDYEWVDSDYWESECYDPRLVTQASSAWTKNVHAIGRTIAQSNSRMYIGEGYEMNDHFIFTGDSEYLQDLVAEPTCFRNYNGKENIVFPFHWDCLELFARMVGEDVTSLEKEYLYSAMFKFLGDDEDELSLDFGGVQGAEQTWSELPGEEYLLLSAVETTNAEEILQKQIAEGNFRRLNSAVKTMQVKNHDRLSRLPSEILFDILLLLPIESIIVSVQSSRTLYFASLQNTLWKRLIHRDMLWFWEAHNVIACSDVEIDFRKFYYFLESQTRFHFAKRGPFMQVANRRRIWSACNELATTYLEDRYPKPIVITDEERSTLYSSSTTRSTVLLRCPNKDDGKELPETRSQFIYSLNEIKERRKKVESYWCNNHFLIGLSVTIDGERRLFGSDDGPNLSGASVSKESVVLERGEWFDKLCVGIVPPDLLNLESNSGIGQVLLYFKDNNTHVMGRSTRSLCYKYLRSASENSIIGIAGQITKNNSIQRIGLLEYFSSIDEQSTMLTESKETKDIFEPYRSELGLQVYHTNCNESVVLTEDANGRLHSGTIHSTNPIFHSHFPSKRAESPSSINTSTDPRLAAPIDLIPSETLRWVGDLRDLSKLYRVSAFVCKGSAVKEGLEEQQQSMQYIIGFRCEYIETYWEPRRYVGLGMLLDRRDALRTWSEDSMEHFDIDGPGGERISEIAVSSAQQLRAIRFKSNLGRECYMGETGRQDWQIQRPPSGDVLVGICVSFGIRVKSCEDNKDYLALSSLVGLSRAGR